MNTKQTTILLITILVIASTIGLLYYANTLSASYSFSPSPSPTQTTTPPTELRVFAASSLVSVIENASQAFETANNCNIVLNSGSSNGLYQQITLGSPCDVFMSADFKWVKQLNASELLYNNNYHNFTTNTLVLMVPKDNPKNITSLLDLTNSGVKIVLAASSVPAGLYANSTLTKINSTWGNPNSVQYKGPEWTNYYAKVIANIVSYEATVEDVVGKLSLGLGTADAGIAFVSDATVQGSNLLYIQIPSDVNTRGTYGIGIIKNTSRSDLATKYMNFWLSDEGQSLLQAYGFGT